MMQRGAITDVNGVKDLVLTKNTPLTCKVSLARCMLTRSDNKLKRTCKMDISTLVERFYIERKKQDRSGIYAYTQRALAYNSNKIEGSTLTQEQTASDG